MKAKTKRKLVSHSRTCFQNMSWKWFIYKKIQNPNFILRTKQFDCCVLFIFFPQKLTTTFQIKIKQKLKNATDNQTHFSKIPNHVFKTKWERERELRSTNPVRWHWVKPRNAETATHITRTVLKPLSASFTDSPTKNESTQFISSE